jgi:hypothetical protein
MRNVHGIGEHEQHLSRVTPAGVFMPKSLCCLLRSRSLASDRALALLDRESFLRLPEMQGECADVHVLTLLLCYRAILEENMTQCTLFLSTRAKNKNIPDIGLLS